MGKHHHDNGEAVKQWADSYYLTLMPNAKVHNSLTSARWKRDYNLDLIVVSENIANICEKSVMESIPYTQHHPIRANTVIVAHPTPIRRRFNLWTSDWNGYSTELDRLIEYVEPIPENYSQLMVKVRAAYRRYIPRGCRTNYIPGLSEESKSMYEEAVCNYPFANGTIETGNVLMNNMQEETTRCKEVITSTNMTHNSCKAWKISRIPSKPNCSSTAEAWCLPNQRNLYYHQPLKTKNQYGLPIQ